MPDNSHANRPSVFLSHVGEDATTVTRLRRDLEAHGVSVFQAPGSIGPAQRWRREIRTAIHKGDYFVACFSDNYHRRASTYQNEELLQAIDKLRQHSLDRIWFIPVRLSECDIPDLPIGAGETLRDLQRIDMFDDWARGFAQILSIVQPSKKTFLTT
jgi:hypothetical protein